MEKENCSDHRRWFFLSLQVDPLQVTERWRSTVSPLKSNNATVRSTVRQHVQRQKGPAGTDVFRKTLSGPRKMLRPIRAGRGGPVDPGSVPLSCAKAEEMKRRSRRESVSARNLEELSN